LSGAGARSTFKVYGYDADGYGTWLEPDDVKLDYDHSVVRVEPSGDGYAVTALTSSGASAITASAAGLTTHLAVSTGRLDPGQYTIGFSLDDEAGNDSMWGYPNNAGNPIPGGPLILTVVAG